MRKKFLIYLNIIFILSCLFPNISFGKESTEIKLNVYEVIINCEENGSFTLGNNNYTETHKVFVGHSGNLCLGIIPNNGYEVDLIEYSSGCDIGFNNEQLEINNIYDNVVINIKFKETFKNGKIPNLGLSSSTEPKIQQTLKENENIVIDSVKLKSTDNNNEYNYGKGKILIDISKVNGVELIELPDKENVIKTVLTQEELKAVADGETITIHIEIKIYEKEDVLKEDKTLIYEFINTYSQKENKFMVGVFMDIKLYKITSSGERKNVNNIEEPIEMVFKIPEEISFKTAIYYIVRIHEGENTLLKDLDDNEDTITIKTSKFSNYIIVYTLSQNNTCYIFGIILAIIILVIVIYIIWKKHNKNKTKLLTT